MAIVAALLLGVGLLVALQPLAHHGEHRLGGPGTAVATSLDLDTIGRAASSDGGATLARAMVAVLPESVPDADPLGVAFGARTRRFDVNGRKYDRHGVFFVDGRRTVLGLTGGSLCVLQLTRTDGGDPPDVAPQSEPFGPVAHRVLVHWGRIEVVLGAAASSPSRTVLSIDPTSLVFDVGLVVAIALIAGRLARSIGSCVIDARRSSSRCAACRMDLSSHLGRR